LDGPARKAAHSVLEAFRRQALAYLEGSGPPWYSDCKRWELLGKSLAIQWHGDDDDHHDDDILQRIHVTCIDT
jgi:hypothetical protein